MSDADLFEEIGNPLDSVEDVLAANDWAFSRPNSDELIVDVKGRLGSYRMTFLWQDEYSAMQFMCQYDFVVSNENSLKLPLALMTMNSELWLGNFDLDRRSGHPVFRYNTLFRGMTNTSGVEYIGDLVDIALNECERFYPVFSYLASSEMIDDASLQLALMSSAGES
jgi:hypothetical protein